MSDERITVERWRAATTEAGGSVSAGPDSLFQARHDELMARLKLLPIFRCLYCHLPHPTRYCPNREEASRV